MRVAPAIAITDDMLVSANFAEETGVAAWSSGTNYAVAALTWSATTHTIYRAVVASGPANGGARDPDVEVADFADDLVDTSGMTRKWQVYTASNLWKLFDKRPSIVCENAGSIEIVLAPGEVVDVVGLRNVTADSVRVVVTDPEDGVVYDVTRDTVDNSGIADGYEYYFEPLDQLTDMTFQYVPPYPDATIAITLTVAGGAAACGQIVLGRARRWGVANLGGGLGGMDFSTVEFDEFGERDVTERDMVLDTRLIVSVSSTRVQTLTRILKRLRGGGAALWLGAEDDRFGYSAYGFLRDWNLDFDNGRNAQITLEVRDN
ncbi:hypothetical protein [uncultured Maritimibacter sp.]|jgi:hypothetical protein|uniref:hypothetical protein n=1 Tax=uncultured Maritimibacter sp. TaxID=991866 RepID=UPI0026333FAF|nr:hypothetical protein [uncultured Maritimibacter sp.]